MALQCQRWQQQEGPQVLGRLLLRQLLLAPTGVAVAQPTISCRQHTAYHTLFSHVASAMQCPFFGSIMCATAAASNSELLCLGFSA